MTHRAVPQLLLSLALLSACKPESPAPPAPTAPAATPQALAEHSAEFRKEIVRAADGVYVAIGYGIANSILLVGDTGVIVVDVMESLEAATAVAAEFRKISDKPVVAFVYTHSHPDHIGGARAFLAPGQALPPVYAQAQAQRAIDELATELQPIMVQRSLHMYGNGLPDDELVNVGIGPRLESGPESLFEVLRPSEVFDERLELAIAGIRLQLVHAPGETDDQLFVWLPEQRAVLAGDNFYRAFPNLYTLRGTSFRDPKAWAASLDRMRALHPEALVPSHTRPLAGADAIHQALTDYRDAIRYVYDQTLRLINRGAGPDELAQLRLPPHLAASPYLQEFYGKPGWSARSIFAGKLGWYDGDPANLQPLAPREEAQRMADLAGGVDALAQRAQDALDRGDAQWALQLTSRLQRLQPGHAQARSTRLAALRSLGAAEANPNARHWYLVAMHRLAQDLELPRDAVRPTPEMLAAMPLALFFDGMAVNLDGPAAFEREIAVAFEFTDSPERYTYLLRRGASEIVPGLRADAQLRVRVSAQAFKETLAKLRNPAVALVRDFEVVKGSKLEFLQFMRLFQPQEETS